MDELDMELKALGNNLEKYGGQKEPSKWQKVKGKLVEVWNRTIFSDMVKEKQENKRLKSEIRQQARQKAVEQLKTELEDKYVEEEKNRIMGVKKPNDAWQKLARGFGAQPQQPQQGYPQQRQQRYPQQPQQPKRNKFVEAMSLGRTGNGILSDEKIRSLIGRGSRKPEQKVKIIKPRKKKSKGKRRKQIKHTQRNTAPLNNSTEDRIKRMLGL